MAYSLFIFFSYNTNVSFAPITLRKSNLLQKANEERVGGGPPATRAPPEGGGDQLKKNT